MTPVRIPGYSISKELYNGSRTLVYRGNRESDSLRVVIKVLKNPYPSFSELMQFRNQYTITKNLNSPLLLQTYSLEQYQNRYVLVMEDFGGISLRDYLHSGERQCILSLKEFLEIGIALSNTLDVLYHHRIIHKDIKPANILINPETKQVKLIDFSIASLLPRETQTLINPNVLEGTLAYISPEQTGRMNRGIDYRTDFYALGVTFYELLTGELPFRSNDPMELVHSHIAKLPEPLRSKRAEEIPQVLCKIVAKLMAKNAEERYQSALGLKFDLEKCLQHLQVDGTIENFEIACRDLGDRFMIPDKLYGRETEVSMLMEAFERVSLGATEMILVAGFSGIGKTAVVNEVHKPIGRQRGYFIKGKYDQFHRNIPLSAFVQTFRDLMGQLLTESEAKIQQWKNKILSALGENGQVIMEVIPELAKIIGEQPPAIELLGTAAENRFNLLFQKFTQVFSSAEHPLVIFLDDLQWADLASLKLIKLLMAETDHLLLIGAYRDNEVNPVHPLILTVNEVEKTAATVKTMTLAPLSQVQVNKLVADTLKCPEKLALPLSLLVSQKTEGNPFFATQFLKALHQENLIKFDFELGCWQCDIAEVAIQAVTEDVVAFMAFQLRKLPQSTQQILQLAACIGNQFDLATLAIVAEESEIEIAASLWKALQEGLILPISDVYKFYQGEEQALFNGNTSKQTAKYRFLHDRVQQAAYSLIPEPQKQATHRQIGQLLRQNFSPIEQEEKLFEIVGHLNLGQELMTDSRERQELAQLNWQAGVKARNSTAYAAARVYLQTGMKLLETNCWQHQYELTLNLYVTSAEVAYLNGDFEGTEEMAALVLSEAQTIFDQIKISEIQIAAKTARSQMLEALAVGRKALSQFGVDLPKAPDEAQIGKVLQELASLQIGNNPSNLIHLPPMSDPTAQAAMQLLGGLFPALIQGMPSLLPLLGATMVRLSLQFGNAPTSTVGYAIHGMVLCAFLGEVETGYGFGRLALSLLSQFNVQSFKCITLNLFGAFIQHRQQALRATIPTLKDGYMAGIETGDFLNATYNIASYINIAFFAGVNLDTLASESAAYSAALAQVKQDSAHIHSDMRRQTVKHLRETVSQPDCLIDTTYDERVMLVKHKQDNDLTAIAILYIYKLLLAYFFGNYTAALDHSTQAKQYLMAVSGLIFTPAFHFYSALTHLALFSTQPESEPAEILTLVSAHQTTLQQWAQNAPMNHLHKWYLVEAERHRVLGAKIAAIECYDQAITLAKENQFINEEALSNELAAKFYLEWGKEQFAQVHLTNAYYCYAYWGAKAKTQDLEQRYPQLLQPIRQQQQFNLNPSETIAVRRSSSSTPTSSTSISDALDFTSILKAATTISSTLELDQLIQSLTRIILENSGAKKCALILPQDPDTAPLWQVRAMTLIQEGEIQTRLDSQSLDSCEDLPQNIIHYVKNTQQLIVIDHCQTDIPGLIGEYMHSSQPQSVLCTPMINKGHLVGILYLENQLTQGVFTPHRLQVINLLSSQAAVSLENARLYQSQAAVSLENARLYQQAGQALQDLKQAQLQIIQSEKMSALGNLVAGVAHEMNNPLGFIAASIKQVKPTLVDIIEHLRLYAASFPSPGEQITDHAEDIDLEYTLEDLPKIIDSISMSCERLENISTSLRTFSRADQDYKVPFHIHQGIDSTLLILKHRLQANKQRPAIEVTTNYGNLPPIECFPGQLNQVFMNLLANAIDALEESNHGRSFDQIKAAPNYIQITTSVSDHHVKITIADNGIGMSPPVKQKIFDYLFTTKAVGKGTGLGLAIARQIVVEKHLGSIECHSSPAQGTEFVIFIPVRQETGETSHV